MKLFLNVLLLVFVLTPALVSAQNKTALQAKTWADSVFNSLSKEEKVAQLLVIRAHSNLGPDHVSQVTELIQKYNVGALCYFQGGPVRQANLTNYYQGIAKTPLMVTIDAEWGLGMRLDSVIRFPYQLSLGAIQDPGIVYQMGLAVGEQCKRIGVHVNYAPVIDINNNANNPVIGYRSFGEDKYKVAALGAAYMQGMQDAGIMACAKHFPGHGDTETDSHYDLPIINKSMVQLDSLELMPFRELFKKGIGSVMIAHLYIPSIDTTANRATSLSKNNVTDLLQNKLGYKGLIFTDALEMKGVSKFFPAGTAEVEALKAGNDLLCLPENVPVAIAAILNAVEKNELNWESLEERVKKVLLAKYHLGLNKPQIIPIENLVADLNAKTEKINAEAAKNAITLLKNDGALFVLNKNKKVAYVGIGVRSLNVFGEKLNENWKADTLFFSYKDSIEKATAIIQQLTNGNYDAIIIGIHDFSNRPANNYNISANSLSFWNQLQSFKNTTTLVFGNVLAVKNFCSARNLVACYQDDAITQEVAADLLAGEFMANGKIPVSVCDFKFGDGITLSDLQASKALLRQYKLKVIDSIANDAIAKKVTPGCVVLAAKDGEIIYQKAFGNDQYESSPAVSVESIFDLASITKIAATTISVMKLYEQGKLDINKKLGDYLVWVKGSDKENLVVKNLLLHEAGLVPFIPFYKETIDSATGKPLPKYYSNESKPGFTVRVAEHLYLRNDWNDTMYSRILKSPLSQSGKYVYSDNDFIFLGKIVESISGMSLDEYVEKIFYRKMGLVTPGFIPRKKFELDRIIPTEVEAHFRQQLIRGDVHDEGAAMFGQVSGHAGLFSSANDLAMLFQMLLNGGVFNGERYLKDETINYFTSYQGSNNSRRGLGFDKPENDNLTRKDPYPSFSVSSETYGHTGFTGTCVWVDPNEKLVYIFLSNRVNPTRDNPKLSQLNVRANIQEVIYKAIGTR